MRSTSRRVHRRDVGPVVVFMVAAPLATVDVKVDLPASTAQPQPKPDKQIFLTIKADRTLALDNTPVSHEAFSAELDRRTGNDEEQRVFLRADKTVDYDTLMKAMNELRGAGYLKVALVGMEETASECDESDRAAA